MIDIMNIDYIAAKMEISNQLLDIANNVDNFTTSDLQGCIDAQIMNAMQAGYDIAMKEKFELFNRKMKGNE